MQELKRLEQKRNSIQISLLAFGGKAGSGRAAELEDLQRTVSEIRRLKGSVR